ncbi:hypothetical protein [Streptomyces fragilis]|uniref:Secreted protein n=1 Tax=Streptomyces fragilis TaxID=67301 RepID=A0ABV2YIW0_9ACTN|nr:hypothetical protein [Streptomyces fragilis]
MDSRIGRKLATRATAGFAGAAALVTALVAGYGSHGASDAAPQSAGNQAPTAKRPALGALPLTPTRGLAKGLALPLDEYVSSPLENYTWQVAVQDEWRTCMARYGFEDFGPPRVDERTVAAQTNAALGRRYGLSDPVSAAEFGYHLPDDVPEPPHWEPAPGAETSVFTGKGAELEDGAYQGQTVPNGGCREEVRRMLPPPVTPEALRLSLESFDQAQERPEVVKAITEWSSCMKKKGYKRDHPLEDIDAPGISISAPTPGAEEIEHAVADVECKKETDLIGIWSSAERAEQVEGIKKNSLKISKEKAAKDRTANKARQMYEEGVR